MGAEKIWCGGVDCATGAGDVYQWRSRVHIGEGYNEVKVGVHQGSILSLKPCHVSSALGSPGRTSVPMTLLS